MASKRVEDHRPGLRHRCSHEPIETATQIKTSTNENISGTFGTSKTESENEVDVQAISFRGFRLVARGMSQAAVDRARAEVERTLEKHSVTAADLDNLTHRYRILGEAGVDVQRLGAADYERYNIDPAHVRVDKRVFDILKAARKLGATHPGSVISFQPNKLHA